LKRVISKESKTILEDWLKNNIHQPYASFDEKTELSKKTHLSLKQVTYWLNNKRKKLEKNFFYRIPYDKRNQLNEYFQQVNQRPSKSEIIKLAVMLQVPDQKIASWFASKRFISKKHNLS
jgi:hypothetical protein